MIFYARKKRFHLQNHVGYTIIQRDRVLGRQRIPLCDTIRDTMQNRQQTGQGMSASIGNGAV